MNTAVLIVSEKMKLYEKSDFLLIKKIGNPF